MITNNTDIQSVNNNEQFSDSNHDSEKYDFSIFKTPDDDTVSCGSIPDRRATDIQQKTRLTKRIRDKFKIKRKCNIPGTYPQADFDTEMESVYESCESPEQQTLGLFERFIGPISFGLSEQTSEVITELCERIPSPDDQAKVVNCLERLTSTIEKISDVDIKQQIKNITDDLTKSALSKSSSLAKDSICLILFVSSCFSYFKSRSEISLILMIISGSSLIYLGGFDKCSNVYTTIRSIMSYLNPDTVAQSSTENLSLGVTALFEIWMNKHVPKDKIYEKVKTHLKDCSRIKSGVDEYMQLFIKLVEDLVNYIRTNYLKCNSLRFMSTNNELVDKILSDIDQLHNDKRLNKFYNNEEGYIRVVTLLGEANRVYRLISSDRQAHGAARLLYVQIQELLKLQAAYENLHPELRGFRMEPICTFLRGGPGTGKSLTMQYLTEAIMASVLDEANFRQFEINPDQFVYNRFSETGYWDGYTKHAWITMFDDWGQATDVAGNPDNEIMNLIRAVNCFSYELHMADLSDKGVTPFCSRFILATTNRKNFLALQSITDHGALDRRIAFDILVVPKAEYRVVRGIATSEWDMSLDWNKLESESDGVKIFTPQYVDFKVLKFGVLTGEVLSFEQLVDKIVVKYNANYKTFQRQKDKVLECRASFRHLYHSLDSVPQMRSFKRNESAMDIYTNDFDYEHTSAYDRRLFDYFKVKDSSWKDLFQADLIEAVEEEMDKLKHDTIYAYKAKAFILYCSKSKWNNFEHYDLEIQLALNLYTDVQFETCYNLIDSDENNYIHVQTYYSFETYRVAKGYVRQDFPLPTDLINVNIVSIKDQFWNAFNLARDEFFRLNPLPFVVDSWEKVLTFLRPWIPKIKLGIIVVTGLGIGKIAYDFACKLLELFFPKTFTPKDRHWTDIYNLGSVDAQSKDYHADQRLKSKNKIKSPSQLRGSMNKGSRPQGSGSDTNGWNLIKKICKTNVMKLSVCSSEDDDKWENVGHVFFIKGRIALMPLHFVTHIRAIYDEDNEFGGNRIKLYKGNKDRHEVFGTVLDILDNVYGDNLSEQDLCIVVFPKEMAQPYVDRIENFATDADIENITRKQVPFVMPIIDKGDYVWKETHAFKHLNAGPVLDNGFEDYYIARSFVYHGFTDQGDCGSIFAVLNSSLQTRKLFGMHVAGSPGSHGISSICTQEMLKTAILEIPEDEIIISSVNFDDNIQPQSGLNLSMGQFNELGSVDRGPSAPIISSIMKSRLHGTYTKTSLKPALLKNSGELKPMNVALSSYCLNTKYVSKRLIDQACESYYSLLSENNHIEIPARILTVWEAIYGIEGSEDFNGIPKHTSSGYPMNMSGVENLKKNLFPPPTSKIREDNPEHIYWKVFDKVSEDLSLMKQGKRPFYVFTDFLKDELRPADKVDLGKSRLISGCPLILCIIDKMYNSSFNAWIMTNRIYNGSAVGINPYSYEWENLAKHLSKFDDSIDQASVGAGDYSKFDGSQTPYLQWAVFKVYNNYYSDYSDGTRHENDLKEDNLVRNTLWYEVTNAKHLNNLIIYEWMASLSSGHPDTVNINTTINNILMRMAYGKIFGTIHDFNENINMVAYGDDVLYAVRKPIRHMFNDISISKVMKDFGFTYTDETKSTFTFGFRNIKDVEFLKRRFRFEPIFSRWLAPLRLEVVLNIPMWTKRVTDRDQIVSMNVEVAVRELSLHEQSVFDYWYPRILDAFKIAYPMEKCDYQKSLSRRSITCKVINENVINVFFYTDNVIQDANKIVDLICATDSD